MSRRYRPFDPFDRGSGPFEPGQQFRMPQVPRRFWGGVALFALAVFIFIAASPIVSFITELQWYDSLGYRDVYTTRVGLQAAVTFGSFVLAFVWLAINVVIALRVRTGGALRAVGIQRSALRTTAGWVSLGSAAVIALLLSRGAYTQCQSLALFLHAQPTGTVDPVLGQDISFYLLTLPFLHATTNWSLGLDFLAILLIGALYSWRGDSFDFRPTPRAIAHVSVLIAAFAVTLAAGAWFGRYDLLYAHTSTFSGDQPLTAQDVQNDQATINNLRLWDYTQLKETYEQQQTIRTYYTFHDIDIDRYTIGTQYQQLEISAREIDTSALSSAAKNWTNQHLQYTHGYGAAASPVNAVVGEGLPASVVGDLPPAGPLKISRPAIYFGEVPTDTDYDVAPSSVKEFDYPQGSQDVFTNYSGTHGVPLNSVNRALWSLKLGDFSLLVSQQVTDKSLMLYRRNIKDRAPELAPFLTFDGDPYLVVVDGRLYWILDAYTTASTYPYSQTIGYGDNEINYIRNSVKVVIDAYEGTTDFYVVDQKDPLIKAYQATFPSLFKPIDLMPSGIRAHLRVPEDLFRAQVLIYSTYHVNADPSGAKVLFAREDVWAVPTTQTGPGGQQIALDPYYVLFRLPGEQNPEFLLIMPFTPLGKNNLVSWLAARNDGSQYGQYVSYVLPKDKTIFGPQQVASRINANTTISADFTLFDQAGSSVQQGNLLVVPIGNSFLYFEPIYLRSKTASSLPELKRVILADQASVAYPTTLDGALQQPVGTGTRRTGKSGR